MAEATPSCISRGDAGDEANFIFTVPQAGSWRVKAYIPGYGGSQVKTVPWIVTHANGQKTTVIDQQAADASWVNLGTFDFHAGRQVAVTVDADAAPEKSIVLADAARLIWQGPQQQVVTLVADTLKVEEGSTATLTAWRRHRRGFGGRSRGRGDAGHADFSLPTSITIPAGAHSASVTLTALSDGQVESPESWSSLPRSAQVPDRHPGTVNMVTSRIMRRRCRCRQPYCPRHQQRRQETVTFDGGASVDADGNLSSGSGSRGASDWLSAPPVADLSVGEHNHPAGDRCLWCQR